MEWIFGSTGKKTLQGCENHTAGSKINSRLDGHILCDKCVGYERMFIAQLHVYTELAGTSSAKTSLRFPVETRLYDTFALLEESARLGCEACQYWRRALTSACFSSAALARLKSSNEPVILTTPIWPTFAPTAANVPILKVTCTVEAFVGVVAESEARRCYNSTPWPSVGFSRDPLHPQLLTKINDWIQTCHSHHPPCRISATTSSRPERLLDARGERPQLVDGAATNGPYMALSYCWGGDQPVKLLRDNEASFREGIDPAGLQQTIRDALDLCQRLSIPYLWVDVCCIRQDEDGQDWRAEANKMQDIYGNAHFTLSVCSAERAAEGFLNERWAADVDTRRHTTALATGCIVLSRNTLARVRASCALAARGWVFQEELLSPRILYWSDQGVFWSCASSSGAEDPRAQASADAYMPDRVEPPVFDPHAFSRTDNPLFLWDDMISAFSVRDFTIHNDRLPAVSGLANMIERRTGEEYLLGLWKGRLPGQLLWTVTSPPLKESGVDHGHHQNDFDVPSWTWASILPTRAVKMPKAASITARARLLGVEKTEKKIHLRLSGRAHSLSRANQQGEDSQEEANAGESISNGGWRINASTREVIIPCQLQRDIRIQLDHEVGENIAQAMCFVVNYRGFLLLEQAGGNEYRRIGCAQSHEDATFFAGAEEREVVLV